MTDAAHEQKPVVPAYVERRENCPRYIFAGGVWIILADAARTAGNIANVESIYQRGGGLPRSIHTNEAEMAYVITGRLRVRIGDEAETTAEPGAMVFVPPGIARSFVADADDTRVYHGFIPAAVERLFAEHGLKTQEMAVAIEAARFDETIAKDYGITVLSD